jgi:hypothetical protein
VTSPGFSPGQRRIVLLLVLIVVLVFALFAGFIITSLQTFEQAAVPTATPPSLVAASASPTRPVPATSTPMPRDGFWAQVRSARLFDQIAHQVEIERGLSPRAEVPLSFLEEREMEGILLDLFSQGEWNGASRTYRVIGLLPAEPSGLTIDAPAGIYVPEHEQLYVTIGRPESDPAAQALLAHAYVHALQDQHFDLQGMAVRAQTTDGWLALQALIEGDATLATALYGDGDLASADWGRWTELILAAEHPENHDQAPEHEAASHLRGFPNEQGRRFVVSLFEHGGWEAVNAAYTNPPRSTEHVLHPSRYLDALSPTGEPSTPSPVTVPDLGAALGEDWNLLLEDTVGEFVTTLYLRQAMNEDRAQGAADGWDGDTLVVWGREDGARFQVWRTFWSTTKEARDFERAVRLVIPQRHLPARPAAPPRGAAGRWWETEGGTILLRRDGRYVTYVCAPDTNSLLNGLEVLP